MGGMDTPGELTMRRVPGRAPELVEPVPALAVVSLDVLLSAQLREWVQLDGADVLRMVGHRFRIAGWGGDGLILRHECGTH